MVATRLKNTVCLTLAALLVLAAADEPALYAQNPADNARAPGAQLLIQARPSAPKAVKRAAPAAVASDRVFVPFRDADVSDDDTEELKPVENAPVAPLRQFQIDPRDFDDLVFGRESTAGIIRDEFQKDLRQRLEVASQICELSQTQTNKLQLAGNGDIQRYFDRIVQLHSRFCVPVDARQGIRGVANPAAELAQEAVLVQRIRNAGLFGDDSLFTKTLRSMASAEQIDQVHARLAALRPRFNFLAPANILRVPQNNPGMPLRLRLQRAAPAMEPEPLFPKERWNSGAIILGPGLPGK
jgi:hypothetical protein